jgi:hypothetical protein
MILRIKIAESNRSLLIFFNNENHPMDCDATKNDEPLRLFGLIKVVNAIL